MRKSVVPNRVFMSDDTDRPDPFRDPCAGQYPPNNGPQPADVLRPDS